jgi:hypothetical protein
MTPLSINTKIDETSLAISKHMAQRTNRVDFMIVRQRALSNPRIQCLTGCRSARPARSTQNYAYA